MTERKVLIQLPVETFEAAERAVYRSIIRLKLAKLPYENALMEERAGGYSLAVYVTDENEEKIRKVVKEAIASVT